MAVVVMLALGVSGALAVVTQLSNGDRVGYQPLPGAPAAKVKHFSATGPPLIYHGGPVMSSNTNYVIYWTPKGSTKFPKGYTKGLDTYFADIAHDSGLNTNVESIMPQYGALYNSTFGGQIMDRDPLPPNGCSYAPICLTDEQLRAEITKIVAKKRLPRDLAHEYFLLTGPGIEDCLEATYGICSGNTSSPHYCAYHGYIPTSGGVIVYANDPYVYLSERCDNPFLHPNGPYDSALLGGLSHEHSESITDPELDAWINEYGEEIGDICRTLEPASMFGPFLGFHNASPYNQVINSHFYLYQQEWSNSGDECKQRI